MVYFFAYRHDGKWVIKSGYADNIRSRLTTHKSVYKNSDVYLLGLMDGHEQHEADVQGKFAYLSTGDREHFKMHPDIMKWIHENTSLDYGNEVTGPMRRFDWEQFK